MSLPRRNLLASLADQNSKVTHVFRTRNLVPTCQVDVSVAITLSSEYVCCSIYCIINVMREPYVLHVIR